MPELKSHQAWFSLVAALVLLAGCGKPADPIVGKWLDANNGEMSVEFKADGTAVWDLDFAKMHARLNRMYPGVETTVSNSLYKKRMLLQEMNIGARWEKQQGGFYLMTMSHNGSAQFKIFNGTLYTTDMGRPDRPFTRMPN